MMKKKLSFGYKAFVMVLFAFILWNGSMVTVGAKKTTNSSNSKSEQQLTESEKSLEDLPEKIQEVIAGKRRFIDATDGKNVIRITIFNNKYMAQSIEQGKEYYFYGKISGNLYSKEMTVSEIADVQKTGSVSRDGSHPHFMVP